MQDGSRKIPKSLKRRINESNIIGDLTSAMKTRRKTSLEGNQALFFEEIKLKNPGLAEFCSQNRTLLGLNDLDEFSPEDVQLQARSLAECYGTVLEDARALELLKEEIAKAETKLEKASDEEKKALIADLARISQSSEAMKQVIGKIESVTGLDLSNGMGGLMKTLMAKIGPKGDREDPTKTLTDLECLEKITSARSISMPLGLAKAMVAAIVMPNVPLVGKSLAMTPIMTMVWPALVAWDVLSLPGNMLGSPFATGNLNNLVKECKAGLEKGPRVAENMPGCSPRESKGRIP